MEGNVAFFGLLSELLIRSKCLDSRGKMLTCLRCSPTWWWYSLEPPHDKTNKICASSRDSDQPWHPPSLISLRSALSEQLRTQCFFLRRAKILIRLGGCPGWSESLLGTHAILLYPTTQKVAGYYVIPFELWVSIRLFVVHLSVRQHFITVL